MTSQRGSKGLRHAIEDCDLRRIQEYINHGVDVNQVDGDGCSPLHRAILTQDLNVVALLLKNGAFVDAVKPDGRTALHVAVATNADDIVLLLLSNCANPCLRDNQGLAPCDFPGCLKNTRRALFDAMRARGNAYKQQTQTQTDNQDASTESSDTENADESGGSVLQNALHAAGMREGELLEQNSILAAKLAETQQELWKLQRHRSDSQKAIALLRAQKNAVVQKMSKFFVAPLDDQLEELQVVNGETDSAPPTIAPAVVATEMEELKTLLAKEKERTEQLEHVVSQCHAEMRTLKETKQRVADTDVVGRLTAELQKEKQHNVTLQQRMQQRVQQHRAITENLENEIARMRTAASEHDETCRQLRLRITELATNGRPGLVSHEQRTAEQRALIMALQQQNAHLHGIDVDTLSVAELVDLEKSLLEGLRAVTVAKTAAFEREMKMKQERYDALMHESQSERSPKEEQRCCKICLEAEVSSLCLPCRHLCMCGTCSERVTACPICRGTIMKRLQVFN